MYRLLIASVAASLATSAAAAEAIVVTDSVPTARISTAGINLQSSKGRKTVMRRIRLAAERVCVGTFLDAGSTLPVATPCYDAAVNSGRSQMKALAGS